MFLYLHVGRVLLGRVRGIQGLCGGRVAETGTKCQHVSCINIKLVSILCHIMSE